MIVMAITNIVIVIAIKKISDRYKIIVLPIRNTMLGSKTGQTINKWPIDRSDRKHSLTIETSDHDQNMIGRRCLLKTPLSPHIVKLAHLFFEARKKWFWHDWSDDWCKQKIGQFASAHKKLLRHLTFRKWWQDNSAKTFWHMTSR